MSTEALQQIAQVAQVAGPIGQGIAERSAGQTNAELYRRQGGQALAASAYQEALARREGRSLVAQQEANAIADGSAGSSQIDVIRQNEVNMIANALAIRHRGATEAAGFESRAQMAEYEGEKAMFEGIQSASSKLMMTLAERRAQEQELEGLAKRRRAKAGI